MFRTWPECQAQVSGYKGAVFKSFPSRPEAEAFCRGGCYQGARGYSSNATKFKSTRPAQQQRASHTSIQHQAQVPQAQGFEAQMV